MDLNDRENIFPYIRSTRDDVDPPNIVHLLNNRQLGLKRKSVTQLQQFAELKVSVSEMKETHCDLPASARSTFLMSFSHDCTKVASTHGDHNIYVSDVKTGKHIRTLEGHPRTPWCIAFHPTSNEILASGCLAGEVRVWDLHGGSEKWRAEHDQVIASLAFHPTNQLLVIATGNSLHFWNWSNPTPDGCCSTNSELERVRYVKFDLLGHRIITGISNLSSSSSGMQSNGFGDYWYAGYRHQTLHHRHHPHHQQHYHHHHHHHHHHPRDTEISRRSIMERLRILPDHETSFRRHPRRNNSSSRTDRPAPSATRADEANRSRSSRLDDESGPQRDNRPSAPRGSERSVTVRGQSYPVGDPSMLLTESFSQQVRRLFQGWLLEEFGPGMVSFMESSPRQTARTPSEDNSDGVSWVSSTSAERSQPQSIAFVQTFNLPSVSNVGTSTDHQNSSLSDHDYFSESDTPQSRANINENLNNSEDSTEMWRREESEFFTSGEFLHTFNRLRGICSDLEQRLSRQVFLQRNDAFEPRAGPSLNDGGSEIRQSEEMRAALRNDNGEVDFHNPYIPIINMLSRIRVALRFSTLSLTALRDRIYQIRRRINEIITRVRYWTGGRRVSRIHQDIFEEMTVQLTDQMDRLLQADIRLANTMSLSEESASVQVSSQDSVTAQSLSFLASNSSEDMSTDPHESNSNLPNFANLLRSPALAPYLRATESPTEQESRGHEISGSSPARVRIARHHYNPLSYERRHRSSHEESPELSSRISRQERLRRVTDMDTGFDTGHDLMSAARRIFNNRSPPSPPPPLPVITQISTTEQNSDVPSSPLTIDISSSPEPEPMDLSSPSVTTETASAAVNTVDSITDTRNDSPQPRTVDLLPAINDNDVLSISREDANNQEISSLRAEDTVPPSEDVVPSAEDIVPPAEANTQASPASVSSRDSDVQIIDLLQDISDTEDDIFTGVHSNEHQSNIQGETGTSEGPTSARTTSNIFERLRMRNIEDISDTELEGFPDHDDRHLYHPRDHPHSAHRRNAGATSSPSASDLDLFNISRSRAERSRLSSYFDPIIEPISDASSDDSDRPITPPLLIYSPTYNSLLFNGNSRIALNDPLTQNHRIQVWEFSSDGFPPIYDATANVVVRRCMIHNDASVDISQDGEKLVALIPPEDRDPINNLMFGVFSLRPGHLGRTLCIWGYISNAISVSFSPLAQYVVVGSAYSRPIYSNPEKAAVAQIIKINKSRDSYDASYIRSFTQVINNENRFQQVSLNCVKWLPMSGLGIAYATNRGCLCICKPVAGEIFENVPNEAAALLVERNERALPFHRVRAFMRP